MKFQVSVNRDGYVTASELVLVLDHVEEAVNLELRSLEEKIAAQSKAIERLSASNRSIRKERAR